MCVCARMSKKSHIRTQLMTSHVVSSGLYLQKLSRMHQRLSFEERWKVRRGKCDTLYRIIVSNTINGCSFRIMLAIYIFNYLTIGCFARGHLPVEQPVFKTAPTIVQVEENGTVFLPCVVDNLGENVMRWWKDQTLIWDSNSPRITRPELTVMNDGISIFILGPENAGEYTCEVLRPRPRSSLKQTHEVQVMYPPTIIPSPPTGRVEVLLGERVQLECRVTGMPKPVVTWRVKDGTLDLDGTNKQKLEFTAVSRLMSGIYQCEADNGVGNPVHSSILVKVLHIPETTAEKTWVHSAPGIKTTLICQVIAEPEARLEWLFNNRAFRTSGSKFSYQIHGNNHILSIKYVEPSDFGNYTCRAYNLIGTSQAHIQLSGVANPVVITKGEGNLPDNFTLIWEVDSYSPIFEFKLLFRKRGSNSEEGKWVSLIIPADSSSSGPLYSKSYTLSGLDKFTVYEVKILARNRFGWSDSSEVMTFGLIKSSVEDEDHPQPVLVSSQGSPATNLEILLFGLSLILSSFKFSPSIYNIS